MLGRLIKPPSKTATQAPPAPHTLRASRASHIVKLDSDSESDSSDSEVTFVPIETLPTLEVPSEIKDKPEEQVKAFEVPFEWTTPFEVPFEWPESSQQSGWPEWTPPLDWPESSQQSGWPEWTPPPPQQQNDKLSNEEILNILEREFLFVFENDDVSVSSSSSDDDLEETDKLNAAYYFYLGNQILGVSEETGEVLPVNAFTLNDQPIVMLRENPLYGIEFDSNVDEENDDQDSSDSCDVDDDDDENVDDNLDNDWSDESDNDDETEKATMRWTSFVEMSRTFSAMCERMKNEW
jgi:hypothetical protein